MPVNPLDNPLLGPVVLRVGILLVVAFALVAVYERKPLRTLVGTTLFLRVRSWALIAPIFIVALMTGGFVLFGLAAFIGIQGSREYARLVGLTRIYQYGLVIWIIVGLLVAVFGRRFFLFLPLGFFVLLTLLPIISGHIEGAHRQVAGTLFGYLYIGLPMGYLVYIKAGEVWGLQFLLLVGAAVALSDVMAYVIGSALRGPKLTPKVSPGKTWAGTIGNMLGAGAGFLLLRFCIPRSWSTPGVVALMVTVGLGAIWGDLAESFVKRDFAVKDTGNFIPGFGGILDRVDSFLMAMPLGYYALIIANHFARR